MTRSIGGETPAARAHTPVAREADPSLGSAPAALAADASSLLAEISRPVPREIAMRGLPGYAREQGRPRGPSRDIPPRFPVARDVRSGVAGAARAGAASRGIPNISTNLTVGSPACVDDPCSGLVNVMSFGADPHGKLDSTLAFKTAREVALYLKPTNTPSIRRIILVPQGTYLVRPGEFDWGSVEWWGGGPIFGRNAQGIIGGSTIKPLFKSDRAVITFLSSGVLRAINVDAAGIADVGVYLDKALDSRLHQVQVFAANKFGFYIIGNTGGHLEHCVAHGCGTGFWFRNCNVVYCRHIQSNQSKGLAVRISGSELNLVSPTGTLHENLQGTVFMTGLHVEGWMLAPASFLHTEDIGLFPAVLIEAAGNVVIDCGYVEGYAPPGETDKGGKDGIVIRNRCYNCTIRQVQVSGSTGTGPAKARAFRIIDSLGCQLLQVSGTEKNYAFAYTHWRDTSGVTHDFAQNVVDAWFGSQLGCERTGAVGPTAAYRIGYAN